MDVPERWVTAMYYDMRNEEDYNQPEHSTEEELGDMAQVKLILAGLACILLVVIVVLACNGAK